MLDKTVAQLLTYLFQCIFVNEYAWKNLCMSTYLYAYFILLHRVNKTLGKLVIITLFYKIILDVEMYVKKENWRKQTLLSENDGCNFFLLKEKSNFTYGKLFVIKFP